MASDLSAWWEELSPETRDRLCADPHGPVSPDLWAEVRRHGVNVVGAHFESVTPGPDGFRLPTEVAEFVEQETR